VVVVVSDGLVSGGDVCIDSIVTAAVDGALVPLDVLDA
jgi:hypothetical protein